VGGPFIWSAALVMLVSSVLVLMYSTCTPIYIIRVSRFGEEVANAQLHTWCNTPMIFERLKREGRRHVDHVTPHYLSTCD